VKTLDFWFDPVSPYAWLAFQRLPEALRRLSYSVRYRPIVFAALLKHHARTKGPAEIEPKRAWTFRQVHWLAPPPRHPDRHAGAHPFNPLALSRLAWATAPAGETPGRHACEQVLRHVWIGGADAERRPIASPRCARRARPRDRSRRRRGQAAAARRDRRTRSRRASSACRRSASDDKRFWASTRSRWPPAICAAKPGSPGPPGIAKARRGPASRDPLRPPERAKLDRRSVLRVSPERFGVAFFSFTSGNIRFRPPRCASSSPQAITMPGRKRQHGHIIRSGSSAAAKADDARGAQGHLRLEPGHRVRVVRLLSVRLARAIIGKQFFAALDPTAAFIASLMAFAAGFLVRPFGAIFFGRLGDIVGRKYTFLVTILIMGLSTFVVGVLPTLSIDRHRRSRSSWSRCGCCRASLWGEYGGARPTSPSTPPHGKRGAYTVVDPDHGDARPVPLADRHHRRKAILGDAAFRRLGLADSVPDVDLPARRSRSGSGLSLNESPAFKRMKEEGKTSKAPLAESFGEWKNAKDRAARAARPDRRPRRGLVHGQFYALFFLTAQLKVEPTTAQLMIGASLVLGTPFFIVFGTLSDKIGRKPIIMAGCLIAALTFFPLFKALTQAANPELAAAQARTRWWSRPTRRSARSRAARSHVRSTSRHRATSPSVTWRRAR
jgi:hypothetical protein